MKRIIVKIATAVVLLSAASPALADSFGAISYSPSTGAMGWSDGQYSRGDAERTAAHGCYERAGDCRVRHLVQERLRLACQRSGRRLGIGLGCRPP